MKTPKQVQNERRAILILVKNGFQKLIEGWRREFMPIYEDLQNFLYGTDRFTWEPYMVSVEELEYYQRIYREVIKN
jgi:hypothetical protein